MIFCYLFCYLIMVFCYLSTVFCYVSSLLLYVFCYLRYRDLQYELVSPERWDICTISLLFTTDTVKALAKLFHKVICFDTTVPLKWTNRSLKLLNYSLLRAILRVNGFEFVPLQPNLTGYNEQRSIRFLSTGQSFGQKPLQLSCSQV